MGKTGLCANDRFNCHHGERYASYTTLGYIYQGPGWWFFPEITHRMSYPRTKHQWFLTRLKQVVFSSLFSSELDSSGRSLHLFCFVWITGSVTAQKLHTPLVKPKQLARLKCQICNQMPPLPFLFPETCRKFPHLVDLLLLRQMLLQHLLARPHNMRDSESHGFWDIFTEHGSLQNKGKQKSTYVQ